MAMIRRSTSTTTGFWIGMAVVVVMCAVLVKQVEGFSDLIPCDLVKGGVNDPPCYWRKGGNRKMAAPVKRLTVTGRAQVSVEPEDDQPAEAPADFNPDEEIDNHMVIVGH